MRLPASKKSFRRLAAGVLCLCLAALALSACQKRGKNVGPTIPSPTMYSVSVLATKATPFLLDQYRAHVGDMPAIAQSLVMGPMEVGQDAIDYALYLWPKVFADDFTKASLLSRCGIEILLDEKSDAYLVLGRFYDVDQSSTFCYVLFQKSTGAVKGMWTEFSAAPTLP